jgi:hypothetical protein
LTSVNATSSSVTLSWSPPTSGGVLNNGAYLVTTSPATATTSVPYCTPGSGLITDAFGNTWRITAGGVVTVNGFNAGFTSGVIMLLLVNGVIQQENSTFNWWGWQPVSGPMDANAAAAVSWNVNPGTTVSPLTSVNITGLAASTPYTFSVTVSNTTGTGPVATYQASTTAATGGGTGPAASSPFITIEFGNIYPYPGGGPSGGLTGQQMVISPRLWGVSTGAAADNSFTRLSSFSSQFATINPGIWRVNGNENDRGDTNYWNNDLSVNTATFARMINTHPTVDPLGISGWVIGANINQFAPGSRGNPPQATTQGLQDYATAFRNLATYLLNATMPNGKKFPIIGFESHNEDEGNLDYDVQIAVRVAFFNAMSAAVKSVSSSLLTFGPTQSFFGQSTGSWQGGVTNFDVYDAHMYNQGNDPGVPTVYQQGSVGGGSTGLTSWPAGKACFLGEYNVSWACSGANLINWAGAMFVANTLMPFADNTQVQAWAGIWDAIGDSDCGIIAAEDQPPRTPGTIYPNGYLIAKGVRTMTGPRWQVPTNSTGMRTMAVTPAAGRFGLMILNNGQGTRSGTIALSHWPVNANGTGTINMWRQTTATTGDGVNSTVSVGSVTPGVTASITFPDPSVTILWV